MTFVIYSKQFVCIYIYFVLFYFACLFHLFYFVVFVFDSVFDDHFFIHGCTSCAGFNERLKKE
jgi:hypothetical protein